MKASHLSPETIETFRQSLSVKGRSTQTMRAYASDLNGLLDHIHTSGQSEGFEVAAATYLNQTRSTAAPKTTQRRLTSIRAFAKWAGHPTVLDEYSTPRPAASKPRPLPGGVDDIHLMIKYCRTPERKALVALLGLCGLRVTEARSVTADSFDFEQDILKVRGKGDKDREIPLSPLAWSALSQAYMISRMEGGPLVTLSDSGARVAFKAIAKDAGIKGTVSSHQGRATIATGMLNKSGNIRVVQEFLGHSSSQTTEVYTQVIMSQMRDASTL